MVRAALLASLVLAGCGGGGGGSPASPPPPPSTVQLTVTPTEVTIAEGEDARAQFHVTATSSLGKQPEFPALTGEDAALFVMGRGGVGTTAIGDIDLGELTGLDFEYPRDANHDNVYTAIVSATDGASVATQAIRVTVTDVVDVSKVTRVATGFNDPVAYATMQNNDIAFGTLGLVAERSGRIMRVDNGGVTYPTPFLDLTGQVSTKPGLGLRNLAMIRDGSGPWLYVLLDSLTDDIELREYQLDPINTHNILPGTERLVLRVDMPDGSTVHRGGMLTTDLQGGRLLVGIGDGTPDPAASNALNPFSDLGKILRILPSGVSSPADPNRNFRIPPENPMATGATGLPEVWAMGLRDPVAGAFDVRSADIYVTDRGETVDEVDRLPNTPAGVANFGWPRREGTNAYMGGADDPSFMKPLAQRSHAGTGVMTGGFAYFGRTELHQSEYIFADSGSGGLSSFVPRLVSTGQTVTSFANLTPALSPDVGAIDQPVVIVQDVNRDLFILDGDGELFKYHSSNY